MKKLVSFVIPAFNASATITDCLDSVRNQSYSENEVEIIVVDNGSSDDTAKIAETKADQVHILPDKNISAVRNYGAENAQGDILVFLDSDCVLENDWIKRMLANFDSDKQVAAVGSQHAISMQDNWLGRVITLSTKSNVQISEVDWLVTRVLAIKKSIFEVVKGFDESLVTCEDVAIGYAIHKAGYKLISDQKLAPKHYGDPSSIVVHTKKEYWRATDNLVIFSQYPKKFKEWVSLIYPLYYLIFSIMFLISIFVFCSIGMTTSLLFLLFPVVYLSIRTCKKNDSWSNFFNFILFYSVYFLARTLAIPLNLKRLFQYYNAK